MRKIYVPLSMLLIGLSLGLTSYTPRTLSSNSDDNQRLVTEQKWKSQPVKVTDVRINGNIITLGQPFRANERDWIRELSFKVTNASDKQMSYARFELQFPLSGGRKPAFFVQDLEYGRSSLLGKSTSSVAPGESFELRVNLDVEAVKHVVQEKAVGEYLKMNRALLSAEIIEFTDNTRWVVGEFLRFDAQKKKWIGVIQPEPWSISEPTFEPATFKPPQQQNCYKSAHDSVDCPGDCGCGTVKPIATPGDPVNAGNFEAPKFQFCCTKDGFQCLVAYDGVASGCTSN